MHIARIVVGTKENLFRYMGDEGRWIPAYNAYRHPEGGRDFDPSLLYYWGC
jgi:hypothetical protein